MKVINVRLVSRSDFFVCRYIDLFVFTKIQDELSCCACVVWFDLVLHGVCTDLEKSWKMTLVMENSWSSKKMYLSMDCPGILKKIS